MDSKNLPYLLIVGAVLPSLIVSLVAAFLVRRGAATWGLIDRPGDRKVHTEPTPLGGGLAIWLAVLATFAGGQVLLSAATSGSLAVPESIAVHLPGLMETAGDVWFLLGAATLLMVLGLIDDRRGLDSRARIAVQVVVACAIVFWKGWQLTLFVNMPLLTGLLSVLWIVALVNAFNMLDNMDGLSAGVAAIVSTVLATVLLLAPEPLTHQPQLFVAGFLLVLVGALLGFLYHNRPPARLFMGDAGSYFVGFCIAVATLLATYTGYRTGNQHAILTPVCAVAVPLYDMATVLWIRVRTGKSPFQADKNHFSHRLVELGLTKSQAVLTIYLLSATCGLGAVLLHRVDAVGAWIVFVMIGCVLALIAILEMTATAKTR